MTIKQFLTGCGTDSDDESGSQDSADLSHSWGRSRSGESHDSNDESQKTQLAQAIVGEEVVVGRDVGEVVEGVGVVVIREAMEGVMEEVRVVEEVIVGEP